MPAVLSTLLGISREEAARELLRRQPDKRARFGMGSVLSVLRVRPDSPRVKVFARGRRPTLAQWLREDGRDAIVAAGCHLHLVRDGRVIEDNGITKRRGRVRYVLLTRGLTR